MEAGNRVASKGDAAWQQQAGVTRGMTGSQTMDIRMMHANPRPNQFPQGGCAASPTCSSQ